MGPVAGRGQTGSEVVSISTEKELAYYRAYDSRRRITTPLEEYEREKGKESP